MQEAACEPLERRRAWRERLTEALGSSLPVIGALLPELERLVGPQPPPVQQGPLETEGRFHRAFVAFVRALAQRTAPLVLFLDDLHWADAGSLRLLGALALERERHHLLLLGAARSQEGGGGSLGLRLDHLAAEGAHVRSLIVQPLDLAGLVALLSEALGCARSQVLPLARLVHRKTAGNPLFAKRLLRDLHRAGLLRRGAGDPPSAAWSWDLPRIELLEVSDNVVDLLLAGLRRLPPETQEVLAMGACQATASSWACWPPRRQGVVRPLRTPSATSAAMPSAP